MSLIEDICINLSKHECPSEECVLIEIVRKEPLKKAVDEVEKERCCYCFDIGMKKLKEKLFGSENVSREARIEQKSEASQTSEKPKSGLRVLDGTPSAISKLIGEKLANQPIEKVKDNAKKIRKKHAKVFEGLK